MAVLQAPWGSYTLQATASAYENYTAPLTIPSPGEASGTLEANLTLERHATTLLIRVVDSETGIPIPAKATVTSSEIPYEATVDIPPEGGTQLRITSGRYVIHVVAPGFEPKNVTIDVTGNTYTINISLTRKLSRVTMSLVDSITGALVPVSITVSGPLYQTLGLGNTTILAASGAAQLVLLQGITYTISITPLKSYYYPRTIQVTPRNSSMSLQVALSRIPVEATFIVVDGNGEMVKDAYVVLKLSQYYTTSAEPSKPAYVLAGRYSVQVVYKGSIILYPAPVDVRESGVYRIVINPSML